MVCLSDVFSRIDKQNRQRWETSGDPKSLLLLNHFGVRDCA